MDVKPANILIPVDGRHLSRQGVKRMFCGVVGTAGYIAPEVEADRGQHSVVRGDLWSCEKALFDLYDPRIANDVLLEIARQLIDEDLPVGK